MTSTSDTRFPELEIETEEQRKAIHRVYLAIKASTPKMNYESFYEETHGSLVGMGLNDESNFGKGIIGLNKARKFYLWMIDNHLALACHLAPEVFDPSLMTRWKDFLKTYAVYDKLTIDTAKGQGLTGRSIHQPIRDNPIPMGRDFWFELETKISGSLLTLESTGKQTFPLSVHADETSVICLVTRGKHVLPLDKDGVISPLSETDDAGLRCYYFLIASDDLIKSVSKGFAAGAEVKSDRLDKIALAFDDVESQDFELHRLNVIFK